MHAYACFLFRELRMYSTSYATLFYVASPEHKIVSESVDIKMERNPAYKCIEKNLQTYANL